jgi:hypothetical protein
VNHLHVRAHHLAEIGKMREMALAMDELSAKLHLQLLDGTRESWLRDIAFRSSAREIQLICDREKVADLVHFHRSAPGQRLCGTAR